MIYTIGGSFWEFGGPDLDRAKLFVMIGTAEDHHSNPMKIALAKFKRDGGRFISVNPVRTGYSAIADEWVPIRPGTDGALAAGGDPRDPAPGPVRPRLPRALHQRRRTGEPRCRTATNSACSCAPRCRPKKPATTRRTSCGGTGTRNQAVVTHTPGADPFLLGEFKLADGTPVKPAFQLLQERVKDYTPEWAAQITGIPADTIRRLAHEMGITARDQRIELPIAWTDSWGNEHDTRHRQSGGLPRDARAGRALQRLSDHPRAGDPDVAAGHDRPARGLSPQGAVPAPDPAVRAHAQRPARGAAEPAAGRHGAGLARRPRRPVRQRRRLAGAHRQGLLVGVPAVGARADAQRHHQRLARRPVPHRHAADLHGQHGVELDHEHGRGAQDAQRQATRAANTRSRSWSSPMPSTRR